MGDAKKEGILKLAILAVLVVAMIFLAHFLIFKAANHKVLPDKEAKIVATNFAAYDFARAVVGDNDKVSVDMLLKPGTEAHDYEPTPQDIATISNADLFIYVGGESEDWVDKLLDSNEINRENVVRMMDLVDLKKKRTPMTAIRTT